MASESVQLHPGAQLTGRIYTPKLSMGQGVIFQGEAFVGPDAMSAAQQMLDENDQAYAAQWLSDRLQGHTTGPQNAPSGLGTDDSTTYPPYQDNASDASQTDPDTAPISQPALEFLDPDQMPSERGEPISDNDISSISSPKGSDVETHRTRRPEHVWRAHFQQKQTRLRIVCGAAATPNTNIYCLISDHCATPQSSRQAMA